MSIAFVREKEGGEAFEDLPDRPISPHTNFVTPNGLAQIEAEVARLQDEVGRLDPNDKAGNARVARDLRYWTARLGSAQLVERVDGDTVHFGSTVTVVREDEADPAKGSISYVAPLARAITGKSVGDVVEVNGHEIEITKIT